MRRAAAASVVERSTRYLRRVPPPNGHKADAVRQAITADLAEFPGTTTNTDLGPPGKCVSTPDGRRSKASSQWAACGSHSTGHRRARPNCGCDASDLDGYCRPFRTSYNVIIAPGHIHGARSACAAAKATPRVTPT